MKHEIKIPAAMIDDIMHTLRHILLNQSSIAMDYIDREFEDWNRTDVEYIKQCLDLEEDYLKGLVITHETND